MVGVRERHGGHRREAAIVDVEGREVNLFGHLLVLRQLDAADRVPAFLRRQREQGHLFRVGWPWLRTERRTRRLNNVSNMHRSKGRRGNQLDRRKDRIKTARFSDAERHELVARVFTSDVSSTSLEIGESDS